MLIARIFIVVLFSATAIAQPLPRHDLRLSKIPNRWDEALPLGNGIVGALIWQKDGNLRISIDRADLWDLRPTADLDKLTFHKVREHVESNTYDEVVKLGDVPYERDPAPTKIPGAALEFDIQGLGKVQSVRLFIRTGLTQIKWNNGVTFTSFVHATRPTGWFRFEGADVVPHFSAPSYADTKNSQAGNSVEGQGLARLGYGPGKIDERENQVTYTQPGWNGFEYQVSVKWSKTKDGMEGCWAMTSNFKGQHTSAVILREQAFNRSYEKEVEETGVWWTKFWLASSISLPDSILERQWYLEQYKFACVARADTPPITLQAVWTADNGNLPPWKGDIHNDLNLQLSYWPAYSANHLEEAAGMTNWLSESRPEFQRWTKSYFEVSGLNVPGVCTLEGKPMGGWIQYSLSPTTAGWLGHHFYLQWRYSMDEKFLREKAYPWASDFLTFIKGISEAGSDGKRKLPMSSSPEFFDNSIKAWFKQTTNYDLAIIRWNLEKAAEMAAALNLPDEEKQWKEELGHWPMLALDDAGGLALAPGIPYPESHRHFSHLLGIHPLGSLQYDKPTDRKIIESSMETLMAKGTDAWVGYSYAWLGNIYARMGRGDEAAKALRTFATCFCLSNSFHANGDQCGGKHSKYTYRPFTLEGNFAFAAGIQEMLLQSHDGSIRVFPAIPESWRDVAFSDLRAEGAFLVSAQRESGKLKEVIIVSEKGGELVLADLPTYLKPSEREAKREGNKIRFTMKAGQRLTFK